MTRTQGWIPSRTEMETSAHLERHIPKSKPRLTLAQRIAFTDGWCNAILFGFASVQKVERDSKAAW